jgi:tetratricopeptide (TPR) repeat protein/tRNA A-37 threonylcarbamoyl transferase component Bud32
MDARDKVHDETVASDLETIASGVEFADADPTVASGGPPARRASGSADRAGDSSAFGMFESDAIPGYKFVREIHRGGQGIVYQAIQLSTKRRVAIKVMRDGPFSGAADKARFDREVHILGQLQLPNIVAIHDSGQAAGCHYFVMDYISGQPLNEYVLNSRLSLRDKLRLFVKVCRAVHAAHLRGVIHRDLKPGNIRVDAEGDPYILDFGLAKTLAEEEGLSGLTMTGQFIGSLPWASPEQAEGAPGKIDIRTDVYSLGVILYQMLTNKFPYDLHGSMRDVLDRIIRAEPGRPRSLCREINDEVERIVLKCLAKERDRRYQTAGEVARDVERYLAGEPIEAKRDSAWYVISKTLQRHRAPTAMIGAGLVMLVAFAVSMTVAYGQIRHEARKAEMTAGFLDGVLTAVDPEIARDARDTELHQALCGTLDAAAGQLDRLAAEPEVEARVRTTLGKVYLNLGRYDQAETQLDQATRLRQALFGDALATAESLQGLGWARKELGKYAEARDAYGHALTVRRAAAGGDDLLVAETLSGLGQVAFAEQDYPQAEALHRAALDVRRKLRAPDRELAASLANLGSVLRDADRLDEAEPLLRQALELRRRTLGDDHPHTVVSMNKLALLLRSKGEQAEARALFEDALRSRERLLGRNHPHVAVSRNNLALLLAADGENEQATEYFESAIAAWRAAHGPDHPDVGQGLVNLATSQLELGRLSEATQSCDQALAILTQATPRRAQALLVSGRIALRQDQPALAEPRLAESVEILLTSVGPDHRGTVVTRAELGNCFARLGRFAEAEPLLADAYDRCLRDRGPEHADTRNAAQDLFRLYSLWGKQDRAREYARPGE